MVLSYSMLAWIFYRPWYDGFGNLLPIIAFIVIFLIILVLINIIGRVLKKVIDWTPFGTYG